MNLFDKLTTVAAFGLSLSVLVGPAAANDAKPNEKARHAQTQVLIEPYVVQTTAVPHGFCPDDGTGTRAQKIPVRFSKPFSTDNVRVAITIEQLDGPGDGLDVRNMRYTLIPKDTDRYGTTVVFSTWCDTNIYTLKGNVIATGSP